MIQENKNLTLDYKAAVGTETIEPAEVLILYHSKDLDGFCSGAVCKKYYETVQKKTVNCIGVDYGEPPVTIHKDQIVVMCDMSYKMEDMARIVEGCRRFTWIDHHGTAINEYNKYIQEHYPDHLPKGNWDVYHKVGISASELCWQYFFKDELMPPAVELLGKYDTWREHGTDEWNRRIFPFQYGMRLERADPLHPLWFDLLDWPSSSAKINNIMAQGEVVIKYQRQQNAMACKYSSFDTYFAGYHAICLNVAGANFTYFESIWDEKKYDLAIAFAFTGKQWKYILLTSKDDVDVSEIAKQHGGGGHKKAAGFTSLTNFLTEG